MKQDIDYRIALVDDDEDILEFLEYNFKKNGFLVTSINSSSKALQMIVNDPPDVVILDVMMPGMDGIELCGQIREHLGDNKLLILMLTARGEDYSQIAGLDAGADDYVLKPINPKVLLSRVNAMLRRKNRYDFIPDSKKNLIVSLNSEFIIDRDSYTITSRGITQVLPRKEFELIALLASKPGKVFSRDEIYEKIWGNSVVGDRTIDVHIRKLRERFGDKLITTIKGVGYKYVEATDSTK